MYLVACPDVEKKQWHSLLLIIDLSAFSLVCMSAVVMLSKMNTFVTLEAAIKEMWSDESYRPHEVTFHKTYVETIRPLHKQIVALWGCGAFAMIVCLISRAGTYASLVFFLSPVTRRKLPGLSWTMDRMRLELLGIPPQPSQSGQTTIIRDPSYINDHGLTNAIRPRITQFTTTFTDSYGGVQKSSTNTLSSIRFSTNPNHNFCPMPAIESDTWTCTPNQPKFATRRPRPPMVKAMPRKYRPCPRQGSNKTSLMNSTTRKVGPISTPHWPRDKQRQQNPEHFIPHIRPSIRKLSKPRHNVNSSLVSQSDSCAHCPECQRERREMAKLHGLASTRGYSGSTGTSFDNTAPSTYLTRRSPSFFMKAQPSKRQNTKECIMCAREAAAKILNKKATWEIQRQIAAKRQGMAIPAKSAIATSALRLPGGTETTDYTSSKLTDGTWYTTVTDPAKGLSTVTNVWPNRSQETTNLGIRGLPTSRMATTAATGPTSTATTYKSIKHPRRIMSNPRTDAAMSTVLTAMPTARVTV